MRLPGVATRATKNERIFLIFRVFSYSMTPSRRQKQKINMRK